MSCSAHGAQGDSRVWWVRYRAPPGPPPRKPFFSAVPVPVAGGLAFQSVSAGFNYSCGLTTAGDVYCWGASLGNVPSLISGGLTFQSVSAGEGFGCGVTTAGDAYCWGFGGVGELGDGNSSNSAVPVAVSPPY